MTNFPNVKITSFQQRHPMYFNAKCGQIFTMEVYGENLHLH